MCSIFLDCKTSGYLVSEKKMEEIDIHQCNFQCEAHVDEEVTGYYNYSIWRDAVLMDISEGILPVEQKSGENKENAATDL